MGLDLIVEGRAKDGHEQEWRSILTRSFRDEPVSEEEIQRFQQIVEPPFAAIGAPRVGYDDVANEWLAQRKPESVSLEDAIQEHHGYYVVELLECDGVPKWSNGNLYEGVDATSFRGSWLSDCTDVLSQTMIDDAWEHRMPEDAIAYGKLLQAAAENARNSGPAPKPPVSGLKKLFGVKPKVSELAFEEQIDCVDEAGRWFVFWGARGNAIRAYF
jgi:hypothetical protein